jgi:hypothetical protein
MAKTKSGAKDARFRHREPVIWHGTRAETLRHHRNGDHFVRPDLCAWVEGYSLRAERLVPPDAPDSVMADLLDEALARQADARGRAPTELVVLDHALAEVLRARFGDRFRVHVRAMGPADEYATRVREARGSDLDDPPRTILDRAAVTAEAVTDFHREFAPIFAETAWKSLSPWSLRFILRAPELGWPEVQMELHGALPILVLSRADRPQHEPHSGRRRTRPSETCVINARFIPRASQRPARIAEGDAHGWRGAHDPETSLGLVALDVDLVPRPLAPNDLAIAETAVRALRAWLAAHGPDASKGAMVSVPGGELIFQRRVIDTEASDDLAVDAWCDALLPVDGPLDASPFDVDRVRSLLRDAPSTERRAHARALAAEGVATVSALLALLEDGTFWEPPAEEPWLVPWVLAALAWSGDSRVPVRMIRAVVAYQESLEDFLTESLPAVFTALGPNALDALATMLRSAPGDSYARDAAGSAIYLIGVQHPDARGRVAEIFAAFYEGLLGEDDEHSPTLASGLAREAARMNDPRVDAAVRAAYAAGIWDASIAGFKYYEADLARPAWELGSHFREASLDAEMARSWWDQDA